MTTPSHPPAPERDGVALPWRDIGGGYVESTLTEGQRFVCLPSVQLTLDAVERAGLTYESRTGERFQCAEVMRAMIHLLEKNQPAAPPAAEKRGADLANLIHRAAIILRTIVTDDEANIAALAALAAARVTTLEDRAKDADDDRAATERERDHWKAQAEAKSEQPAAVPSPYDERWAAYAAKLEAGVNVSAGVPDTDKAGADAGMVLQSLAAWADDCAGSYKEQATAMDQDGAVISPISYRGRARAYSECAEKIRAALAAMTKESK